MVWSVTVVPPSGQVLAVVAVVGEGGVSPPRDPVGGWEFAGALGLVEQNGLHQDLIIIILGAVSCGDIMVDVTSCVSQKCKEIFTRTFFYVNFRTRKTLKSFLQ